jgi:Domain of unknown function (DUF3883)
VIGDQLVMQLTWEQGRGRETQVQPPLDIWRQYFGVTDIYATPLPSFRLINQRARDIEEPTRPAVLHHHNVTIEIAGAVAPRPAIIRMLQTGPHEFEYIVYRPRMSNFRIFDSLLREVPNPFRTSGRRWFIAPEVPTDEWPLSSAQLNRLVRERLRDLAEEDEITAARSVLAELAGQRSEGQGYESHDPRRKAIEDHAMKKAIAHYRKQGWTVVDVSAKRSYDLLCKRGRQRLHVEVKGTTSAGESVLLTKNEVQHARGTYPHVALYVVAGIRVGGDPPRASGGRASRHEPWNIEEGELEALGYEYRRPSM